MNRDGDGNLLQRLSVGDKHAFTDIYNQYWASLFKYIIRIVSSEEDAADIVQETFVTFWGVGRKLKEIKSIKAYLFVMARNLAFKRLREQLKKVEIEDKLVEYYGQHIESVERLVSTKELSDLLDTEIDKLPKRMREIFVLSRKEHLSYKEIAERLNISDQTVKKQIYHSLKYLRLKIDDEYIPYLSLLLLANIFL
ncbi:RNA polymerase sigma factor [Olivibacter sitiensis]|uniref:RNA polymerase sigma factor n=1 Tax=Olivibacter sitiensis TaxID=376470 RepID=UPI0004091FF1|nr:RNA polymerase sigma-70 factor [Olivibacter sitiensis]